MEGRKKVSLQWKKSKSSNERKRDWSLLPGIAVDKIIDRLNLYDYIIFASVCVSWRCTALDHRNHRGNLQKKKPWDDDHQLPLLMLPFDWCGVDNPAQFYSVLRNSPVLEMNVPYYSQRFIGSSFGWVISLDYDLSVHISNPFAPCLASVCLPPVLDSKLMREDNLTFFGNENVRLCGGRESVGVYHSYCNYYIVKAIMSADPGSDYVVLVVYGWSKKLAFIKPSAGTRWIYLDSRFKGFSDVIYSKSTDSFHAVHEESGEIYRIKIRGEEEYDCFVSAPSLEIIGKKVGHHYLRYIVETCEGDFLQIIRRMGKCGGDLLQVIDEMEYVTTRSTDEIKVHRLQKSRGSITEWVEAKDLGDNALFLGDSASISVAPSRYPNTCLRAGSIYFLLPYLSHLVLFGRQVYTNDMGVVNIQQNHEQGQPFGQPFRVNTFDVMPIAMSYRPPVWVLPTFQGTQPRQRNYDFEKFV